MVFLYFREISYNNSIHSSIGYTPFVASTSHHPNLKIFEHPQVSTNSVASSPKGHVDRHGLESSLDKPKFKVRFLFSCYDVMWRPLNHTTSYNMNALVHSWSFH